MLQSALGYVVRIGRFGAYYMHQIENEKELIARCQQGETELFGPLYDRYVRVIYGFIYYKTFHKETAEDLTSETFFKALTHIQTVDPSRSFQSWLYKIAQNSVIDHFRRERYMENIDDIWDVADGANVETDASVALEIRALRKELHNLSRRERDIVIMRVWQELSYREIAEILGKSEASCKMSYSRVVSKLKQTVPVALGIPSLDNNGTN